MDVEGPWNHRIVSANGSNFHVAEAGEGPLVVLLHGFPEFWWTWRNQIPALAKAGYRAVAMDLRGYGGSDKPPRGYDAYTFAGDVIGLIHSLGEDKACLIGHDWGGVIAWTTTALAPETVQGMALLGMAHPARLRHAWATDRKQLVASRHVFAFQIPRYEHRITAKNAGYIADLFEKWAGPAWRASTEFTEHVSTCRRVFRSQQTAFCALEYYRWVIRSMTRRSGWRFHQLMTKPVNVDVIQLHGTLDTCILPSTARGANGYTTQRLEYQQLDGVGHFPHLEAPEHVSAELIRWLDGIL